jgi:uncharacterized cupin superfamily protein
MSEGIPIHVDDVPDQRWKAGEIDARRRRLGVAANALRMGVAIIEVAPGARSTPPHVHIDEDEVFLVLEGSGISWQSTSSKDVRAYAVGKDDVIFHRAQAEAHTLIAGDEGLTVLVAAEGSRTHLTWLPRAKQFWVGPRWSPADMPPPFTADAQLGPLEVPDVAETRPPTIRNLADLSLSEGREGPLAYATRDAREMGSERLVLAHDAMPPDTHNTELHFHSTREECWYVRGGSGVARIGTQQHELRPGSFWLRRPNGGVGHRIEVGPDGMDLITMGDLVGGDVVPYPERGTVLVARGVELPYQPKD